MSRIVKSKINIEAKREQIMKNIDQQYENYLEQEKQNHVQPKAYVIRNLLLLGASKSGKTTFRNVLVDPGYLPKQLTLLSLSYIEINCILDAQPKSSSISLNIIEIPSNMIDVNSNLSEINQTCIDLGIVDIHFVCFCASFLMGIDGYAAKSFIRIIEHFGQEKLRHNLLFIITQCEMKNDEQRRNIKNELLHDKEFGKLIQNQADRIFFSGALNPDDYNKANDSLYDQFETVYYYRKKLLEFIQSDIRPFLILLPQQQIYVIPPSQSSMSRNDHRANLNESNSYQPNFLALSNNQNADSILESQCIGRKNESLLAEYDCLNDLNDPSILHSNDKSSNKDFI